MRTALALLTVTTIAVAGCTDRGGSRDDGADHAVGGTMVIASPGTFTPSLPPIVQDEPSRIIADLVYDRLTDIGPELNTFGDQGFTPRLARRWTWSADSLSIVFELDPRARWHDGRPVRATDVRFSFDVQKDPATGAPNLPLIGNVDSISVRDSLTAVAWFSRRTLDQFYSVAYLIDVVPEHVLAGIARDQLRAADIGQTLIGSGPFRLGRIEPGVRFEIVADTGNYQGRPNLDRVIWSVTTDAGAGLAQFMSGQADMWANLPADLVAQVDSTPSLQAIPWSTRGYAYMAFNMRDPRRQAAPHPVLSDRQVRRALSMALDREAMLRNVFGELGAIGVGPYPRALGDSTVTLLPFDRSAAAALLDSAGWRMGPNDVRLKNGQPLAFSILTPTSSAPRMRYAVLLQEQLRSIGARVTIDAVDFRAYLDRMNSRNFDAILSLWNPDPGFAGIRQTWTTHGMSTGGNNHMAYSNPRVDALVDSATNTMDVSRGRAVLHEAYQLIVDDAPAVWLYDYVPVIGLHARIRTTEMPANGWWINLEDWWIPESERIDRDRVGLRSAPAEP